MGLPQIAKFARPVDFTGLKDAVERVSTTITGA